MSQSQEAKNRTIAWIGLAYTAIVLNKPFFLTRVEEIHSVGTINNVETSYFTQLKIRYLMTTCSIKL